MWGVLCRLTIGLTFLTKLIRLTSYFGGSRGRSAGWWATAFIVFFVTLSLIASVGLVKAADVNLTASSDFAEPGRYVKGAPASGPKWTAFVGVSDTGAPANVSMRCETFSDLSLTIPANGWYRVEAYNGGYPFFGGNSQALRLTWTGPGDAESLPNGGNEMVFSQTSSWSWQIVSGSEPAGHLGHYFVAGVYTCTAETAFTNESFWLCGWRVTSVELEVAPPPPDDGGGGGDPGGGDPGDGGGGGGGTPTPGPTGGDCWWWTGDACWPKYTGAMSATGPFLYGSQNVDISFAQESGGECRVDIRVYVVGQSSADYIIVLGRNGFINAICTNFATTAPSVSSGLYLFENGDAVRNAVPSKPTWSAFEETIRLRVADHMDAYSAALSVPRTADQTFDGISGSGSGGGDGSGGDDQVPTGEDPDEDGDGCPKSRDPDDSDATKSCSSPRDLLDSSYLNIKSRVKRELGLDGATIESKDGTFAMQVPWVDGSNKTFNMTNKVESTTPGGSVIETFRVLFRAFQVLFLGISTWESCLLTLRQW